jgi:hypothetical protein
MFDLLVTTMPSLKFLLFTITHFVTLMIQITIRPYQRPFLNIIDTVTLISLCLLAMVMTAFPDPHTRTVMTDIDDNSLSAIITLLIGIPVLSFIVYALVVGIKMIRHSTCCCTSSSPSSPAPIDAIEDNLDDGMVLRVAAVAPNNNVSLLESFNSSSISSPLISPSSGERRLSHQSASLND